MRYILDSDTLIRAKNDFYSFETVPGFWTWLTKQNEDKVIYSCSCIRKELLNGEGDNLRNWAKNNGDFFLSEDNSTAKSYEQIVKWVHGNAQFSEAAKQEFFRGADPTLIAHAHAHNFTLVTFEVDAPAAKSKVPLPTVAKQFGVIPINLFHLTKMLKASLG